MAFSWKEFLPTSALCDAGFHLLAFKSSRACAQGYLCGLVAQHVLGRFDVGPQLDRAGAVDRTRDPLAHFYKAFVVQLVTAHSHC